MADLQWLCPVLQTAAHMSEEVLVEHNISILPFKLKNWVKCHQQDTLEEVVILMEAYALAEVGAYLIPKVWKGQAGRNTGGGGGPQPPLG